MGAEADRAHGVPVEISFQDIKGHRQRVYFDFDESINEFRVIASDLGPHPHSTEWFFGQRTAAALIQLLRFHIADAADELGRRSGGDGR